MVDNTSLIYNEPPHGVPVPGTTLKKVVDESFNPDTVQLDSGFLLKLKAASLDPYLRGKMRDPKVKSYNQPFELGKPIDTLAIGEVIRSEHADVKVGDLWRGLLPLSEYVVVKGDLLKMGRVHKNEEGLPFTTLVGAAGMPGSTAFVGLTAIGKIQKGETIFISAASGAVGQIAVALALREGLKVIASAGSDDKVAFVKELGADVVFNYKTTSTLDILKANPFDVFFDNVGGEVLDNVLETINNKGRIIACGSVSQYNVPKDQQYAIKNTSQVVVKSLRWEGFIVSQHDLSEFERVVPKLIKSGKIKVKEHVIKGIDNGEAFVDMLAGKSHGKAVYSLE